MFVQGVVTKRIILTRNNLKYIEIYILYRLQTAYAIQYISIPIDCLSYYDTRFLLPHEALYELLMLHSLLR